MPLAKSWFATTLNTRLASRVHQLEDPRQARRVLAADSSVETDQYHSLLRYLDIFILRAHLTLFYKRQAMLRFIHGVVPSDSLLPNNIQLDYIKLAATFLACSHVLLPCHTNAITEINDCVSLPILFGLVWPSNISAPNSLFLPLLVLN